MKINKPLKWKFTSDILDYAVEGLNKRAQNETSSFKESLTIDDFGEALAGVITLEHKIKAILTWYKYSKNKIKGTAVELGAGTGIISAIISKSNNISKVYAVEYSEDYVENVMPIVFDHFKANQEKIQRVTGDFNNIELPDESVDLIIEYNSFHHSENLGLTLRESYRILKDDGIVICLERAHTDNTPEEILERARKQELGDVIKVKWGLDPKKSFTRQEAGEHEYRVSEWCKYFDDSGFKTYIFRSFKYRLKWIGRLYNIFPLLDIQLLYSIVFRNKLDINLFAYGYDHNHVAFLLKKNDLK